MSEKKMVRRSVAIALGIICIVLVATLVGTLAFMTFQVTDANSEITNLQSQLDDWVSIVNLGKNYTMTNRTITIPAHRQYEISEYLNCSGLAGVDLEANSTKFTVEGSWEQYDSQTGIFALFQEVRNYNDYTANPYFPFVHVNHAPIQNNFSIIISNNSTDMLAGKLIIIYYY